MDIFGAYTEVLIRWMERIESGVPPYFLGDELKTMVFVNVADIARANILAAEADVTDDVFNIASGIETRLAELAQALSDVMKSTLPPEHGPARSVNAVTRRLASTTHAERGLGFRPELSLHEGLQGLVDWWRAERIAEAAASAAQNAASPAASAPSAANSST